MSHLERWATLQEPSLASPLKGAIGRIVSELGLSPKEAGRLLVEGIRTGAISLHDADTGAVWLPSERAMNTEIDWANGYMTISGVPLRMLVVHWPDVQRLANGLAPGPTIKGWAEPMPDALAAPVSHQVRAEYSDSALGLWLMLREHTWPADQPTPNEAADIEAAKRHFDSIPARDAFRRIRQAKTSQKWRRPGPRNRR